MGVAMAGFFSPFQIFLKHVHGGYNEGVINTAASYTSSWPIGIAVGAASSGYLWNTFTWRGGYVVALAFCIMTAVSVWYVNKCTSANSTNCKDERSSLPTSIKYLQMPDLIHMNRVVSFMGILAMTLVRALLPDTGKAVGISKQDVATTLFLICGGQAIFSLFLFKSRTWMYRRDSLTMFAIIGLAGYVVLVFAKTPRLFFASAVLLAVYSSSIYFCFVFHSLVNPEKASRYVSTNESLSGLCSVFGPAIGGFLAAHFSMPKLPYEFSMILVIAIVIIQITVLTCKRRSISVALGGVKT
jgi:predicted MFS family arabinose efflux permease